MVSLDTASIYKKGFSDPVAIDAAVFIKRAKRHIADGCICCKRALLSKDDDGVGDQPTPSTAAILFPKPLENEKR